MSDSPGDSHGGRCAVDKVQPFQGSDVSIVIVSLVMLAQSVAEGVIESRNLAAARKSGVRDDSLSSAWQPHYLVMGRCIAGAVVSLLAFVVATVSLIESGNREGHAFFRGFAFYLLWTWLATAILYRYYSRAGFVHMRWVLGLPLLRSGRGDLVSLMQRARQKMDQRHARHDRWVRAFVGFILAGTIVMALSRNLLSEAKDEIWCISIALLVSIFVYNDIRLLWVLYMITVHVRRLDASNALRALMVRLFAAWVGAVLVILFDIFVAVLHWNDWNNILSTFALDEAQCVGMWVKSFLILPNMLVYPLVNSALNKRHLGCIFCGDIGACLRHCADQADALGEHYDAHMFVADGKYADLIMRLFESESESQPSSSFFGQGHERGRQVSTAEIMQQVGCSLHGSDAATLVIPAEFIEIEPEVIAAGGFGQIHRGTFAGKKVAVKKIFSQMLEGGLDEIRHEVRILNNLRGVPHVILLHGVSMQSYHKQQVLLVVLDWCPLSLADIVRHPRENPVAMVAAAVDPATFLAIAKQLVNALRVLHHKSYVHLDLKPENILFAQSDDLKASLRICDFGSARMTGLDGACPAPEGLVGISPLFAPPEAIDARALAAALRSDRSRWEEGSHVPLAARGEAGGHALLDDDKSFDGRAFDLYSLGVLLWEVWHQSTPELSVLLFPDSSVDSFRDAAFAAAAEDWTLEVLRRTLLGWRPDPYGAAGPLGPMPAEAAGLLVALGSSSPAARPAAASLMASLNGAAGQAVGALRAPMRSTPEMAEAAAATAIVRGASHSYPEPFFKSKKAKLPTGIPAAQSSPNVTSKVPWVLRESDLENTSTTLGSSKLSSLREYSLLEEPLMGKK